MSSGKMGGEQAMSLAVRGALREGQAQLREANIIGTADHTLHQFRGGKDTFVMACIIHERCAGGTRPRRVMSPYPGARSP
jgi:hypothetical protein